MSEQTVPSAGNGSDNATTSMEIAEHQPAYGVTNDQQPTLPTRLGAGLLVGPACWMLAYVGVSATLLPAKLQILAPSQKVALIPLFSLVAMIAATISNIIAGALSDITRSRFGSRSPWIVCASIACGLFFVWFAFAGSWPMLLVIWTLYNVALNCVTAPMIAQISDRIAPRWRGTISSCWGIGMAIGNYGSGIIASSFIKDNAAISTGVLIFALIAAVGGVVSPIIMREPSNLNAARAKFDAESIKRNFMFPTKNCRDYYFALVGKMLMVTGQYVIVGYQLYIFSDYMKLDADGQNAALKIMSMILMVTGIVFCVIAGPLADRFHRLKLPVAITTIMLGVGAFFPFFAAEPWTMYAYALVAGIGMGAYNAVDGALNVAVLPDPKTAAKDLGIINMANTLGQIFGPAIAGAILTISGNDYRWIFPTETIICVIGGLLILAVKRVK
ncbi:MFS transporter [Bifidobacterium sp. SO1]|uniref:MFS transporter n=1 Tax=Bifidobacterium sp. SO1 TaxID=2809029 RepID=UPI001BDD4965|nr:MFS transporter [Bifidobacterium sp. SO1]MBT1161047.1 MFS transporter [Bifidobacterium sp. SO1]